MNTHRSLARVLVVALIGIVLLRPTFSGAGAEHASGVASTVAQAALPRTRPERTNYTETSSLADVVAFMDSLQRLGAPIWVGSAGKTAEGRDLVYAIASRPLVTTPAQARRLGRPIVYVEGNIHSGEVEGKEALQALLRDLSFATRPNALDSIVLIALPNYNADGNERLAPQAQSRGQQNGPAMTGTRNNGVGLNLNRDYAKADAAETRASLALFNTWDPDVYVDLHTSDGSYHGYALTYSPSLNPAGIFGGVYARDSMLPEIRRRVKSRHNFEIFDYGNFRGSDAAGWQWNTYEHTPRYGSNYYALRGRIGLLSEAYSHDPLSRRVASTYAFVTEILSLVAERTQSVLALSRRADAMTTAWGLRPGTSPAIGIRSTMTREPFTADVLVEEIARDTTPNAVREPGMRAGERRTGRIRTVPMQIFDRFTPTVTRTLPGGWALDSTRTGAVALLRLHGIVVDQLTRAQAFNAELFKVDTVLRVSMGGEFGRPYSTALRGTWRKDATMLPAGSFIVSAAQPLGILALYLLDPESDESVSTWNKFDDVLKAGLDFPVVRIMEPLNAARRMMGGA